MLYRLHFQGSHQYSYCQEYTSKDTVLIGRLHIICCQTLYPEEEEGSRTFQQSKMTNKFRMFLDILVWSQLLCLANLTTKELKKEIILCESRFNQYLLNFPAFLLFLFDVFQQVLNSWEEVRDCFYLYYESSTLNLLLGICCKFCDATVFTGRVQQILYVKIEDLLAILLLSCGQITDIVSRLPFAKCVDCNVSLQTYLYKQEKSINEQVRTQKSHIIIKATEQLSRTAHKNIELYNNINPQFYQAVKNVILIFAFLVFPFSSEAIELILHYPIITSFRGQQNIYISLKLRSDHNQVRAIVPIFRQFHHRLLLFGQSIHKTLFTNSFLFLDCTLLYATVILIVLFSWTCLSSDLRIQLLLIIVVFFAFYNLFFWKLQCTRRFKSRLSNWQSRFLFNDSSNRTGINRILIIRNFNYFLTFSRFARVQ